MGAPDRMLAFPHKQQPTEAPMLKIVPAEDAPAKRSLPRCLAEAFRAEVDARVGGGDFADREEAALALANEVVREDLTAALEQLVAEHGAEDVLVDGERYRLHEHGSQTYQRGRRGGSATSLAFARRRLRSR